ncbi:hypothetical protein KL910_004809 [Ogataea haglerorum]|nr:hypothetical protein KL945_004194 [Ogataea haglerorum]KAG7785429.1 hypothetical protein KL910_004809 [Ogataea haglerorum]
MMVREGNRSLISRIAKGKKRKLRREIRAPPHFCAIVCTSLCFSRLAATLSILVLNPSPYGSSISTAFHQVLSANHKVISVSPLHLTSPTENEVTIDTTPISDADLKDFLDEQEFDLDDLLGLQVGDKFYGCKQDDRWYVKGSVMGTALFALDYLLPHHYTEMSSIDIIIVASAGHLVDGLYCQQTYVDLTVMRLAQTRNIPVLNVNSNEDLGMIAASPLDEYNADEASEFLALYIQRIEALVAQLTHESSYGKHNFHTSRSLQRSPKLRQYFENERRNDNPRLLPNGVGLNINLRAQVSCMDTDRDFSFIETRTIGGYNKVPSLSYDETRGVAKIDSVYSIDKDLPRNKDKILSEMSVDNGDCLITVTPISWSGGDFETYNILGNVLEQLNADHPEESPKLVQQIIDST